MSDPKVKPSIAARELANAILDVMLPEPFRTETAAIPGTIEDMAIQIQSALVDLLEKAKSLKCVFGGDAPSHGCACNNCDLAKAIAPWKTTI